MQVGHARWAGQATPNPCSNLAPPFEIEIGIERDFVARNQESGERKKCVAHAQELEARATPSLAPRFPLTTYRFATLSSLHSSLSLRPALSPQPSALSASRFALPSYRYALPATPSPLGASRFALRAHVRPSQTVESDRLFVRKDWTGKAQSTADLQCRSCPEPHRFAGVPFGPLDLASGYPASVHPTHRPA
ncbi:MAG: hypothetical protein RI897_4529 [Verrucomicrobiota bacterium]